MRILYLNHNIAGRGTYFRCLHFARCVAKAGHSITLVTCADRVQPGWHGEIVDGVRVLATPRFGAPGRHDGGYAPVDLFARCMDAVERGFELVHAFDHRPNVLFPAWFHRRLRRTPVLVDWADWWTRGGITTSRRRWDWVDRLEARIEEGQKRRADAVTVTSEALHRRALDLGVPPERLLLLPSGADVKAIPVLERTACREALGLPAGAPIAVLAGFSLWDLEHLLDAMQHVVASLPEARLVIVGLEKEGGVDRAVAARGLVEHVVLAGPVPYARLPDYLGAADVCVLPLQDTLANRARGPIKFGDYLAAGRAVVTQRVGDCAALVEQHDLGAVADCTAAALGQALADLLSAPERCAAAGARARAFAEAEWSWERQAMPLLALYGRFAPRRWGR